MSDILKAAPKSNVCARHSIGLVRRMSSHQVLAFALYRDRCIGTLAQKEINVGHETWTKVREKSEFSFKNTLVRVFDQPEAGERGFLVQSISF